MSRKLLFNLYSEKSYSKPCYASLGSTVGVLQEGYFPLGHLFLSNFLFGDKKKVNDIAVQRAKPLFGICSYNITLSIQSIEAKTVDTRVQKIYNKMNNY